MQRAPVQCAGKLPAPQCGALDRRAGLQDVGWGSESHLPPVTHEHGGFRLAAAAVWDALHQIMSLLNVLNSRQRHPSQCSVPRVLTNAVLRPGA